MKTTEKIADRRAQTAIASSVALMLGAVMCLSTASADPMKHNVRALQQVQPISKADIVGFNPQPDPPRTTRVIPGVASKVNAVALNPQPLPPKEVSSPPPSLQMKLQVAMQ
jgi:hypothetical protein